MKLRSLVFLSAVAAGTLSAAELTSNTLGWLKVTSSEPYTIIAVPWLAVGGGDVKVADLVKTDNLTAGDKLFLYTGSGSTAAYQAWSLKSESVGEQTVLCWQPLTVFTQGGKEPNVSAGPANATIVRGKSLWLYRQGENLAETPFYLYGQYEAAAATATLTKGSEGAPVWNMIANPNATDFDLNGTSKFAGGSGDSIMVPSANGISRIYTYKDSAWGYDKKVEVLIESKTVKRVVRETANCTIPHGTGCWYVSVSADSPATINW